jgi:hypothetical protein
MRSANECDSVAVLGAPRASRIQAYLDTLRGEQAAIICRSEIRRNGVESGEAARIEYAGGEQSLTNTEMGGG